MVHKSLFKANKHNMGVSELIYSPVLSLLYAGIGTVHILPNGCLCARCVNLLYIVVFLFSNSVVYSVIFSSRSPRVTAIYKGVNKNKRFGTINR